MKKASILITTLFLLSVAPFAVQPAEAQSRSHAKGHKKTTKRTQTTRRSHSRHQSSHRHRSHSRHHRGTHRHHRHRSGVRVHVGWPYHSVHYGRHHRIHRHHTVVYDRTPDVVVVEAERGFVMPALDCPIRTDEVRSGMQQWCATGRGTKHGTYRRWYADGVLAAEGEYDYDTKDGVWIEYHPNGALREEGAFRNGKRTGTWITWGSDGQELVAVDY